MPVDIIPSAAASAEPTPGFSERVRTASISVESAIWLLLLTVTAFTRFWNLGYREFHHDEGFHVVYSWRWVEGIADYVHRPVGHGPLLYHLNAFVYLILGESNTTSRLAPALAGVAIVGLPWLLRSRAFLGRWGGLAAGVMLFLSPSMLYYTRFIRHDPYTVLFSLTLAIAIFRYLQTPQRRWMMTAFISVALLMTNHEIFFAIFLVFIAVLWIGLLVTRLRSLIPVHLAAGVAGFGLLVWARIRDWEPLPRIPWQNPTAERTRIFYEVLLAHPLVISFLILGAVTLVALMVVAMAQARFQRNENEPNRLTSEVLFGHAPSPSVANGVLAAWRDPIGLAAGALVALVIWLTLYTSLFTNPDGIATGTYAPNGTLLYWLGQQEEQRGSQPWFYFLTEGLQYEWLALVLGFAGGVFALVRLWKTAWGQQFERNTLFLVFCASWMAFMFLTLSWAGEKMPWLIIHIVAPATLIGAVLVDEVAEAAIRAWHHRSTKATAWTPSWTVAVVGSLMTLAFAGFFLLARLTIGDWMQLNPGVWERVIPRAARDDWWMLAIPPLVALVVICAAMVQGGFQRAAHATLAAALTVMVLFQVNAGYRVTFLDGDGAKDTLIYNTVGTDVMQLRNDLEAMSQLTYGNLSMPIVYDSACLNTPLAVDLNHLPNAEGISGFQNVDEQPPVIIGGTEFNGCNAFPDEIDGYTAQTYMFRWHEREADVYRNFAIAPEIPPGRSAWKIDTEPHDLPAILGSVWDSCLTLTTADGQQKATRLLFYHEADAPVIVYPFHVFVRNDFLPAYNEIRYGR